MYGVTEASSGYRCSHSSASTRVAAHLTPTVPPALRVAVTSPRKTKIFGPTLTTVSPSHGWSCHAPGLARQYLSNWLGVTVRHGTVHDRALTGRTPIDRAPDDREREAHADQRADGELERFVD